jgi:hypothetical protein
MFIFVNLATLSSRNNLSPINMNLVSTLNAGRSPGMQARPSSLATAAAAAARI